MNKEDYQRTTSEQINIKKLYIENLLLQKQAAELKWQTSSKWFDHRLASVRASLDQFERALARSFTEYP